METPARTLEQLSELLKRKYQEDPHIERLFYPDNPLPLNRCYLHLALIEEKEVKKVKEEESKTNDLQKDAYARREFFLHDYERIEHIQRKLDVKDLLIECKKTPRRIYIEGAAGAGKSTISRYIAYQWARNKKPWKDQYELMFYIKLRELNSGKYTEKKTNSLIKVIEQECFPLGFGKNLTQAEIRNIENHMRINPRSVLFVLDGLDELQLTTNYIARFWENLIKSDFDTLVTSRPGIQQLSKNMKVNLNLAVLGFSDDQIEKYIKQFFKPKYTPSANREDAQAFLTDIRANNNLWSLAHTPIQLELICSIWGNELKQQDLNLTNLYRLMLERILKRNEQLILKRQGKEVGLNDIDIKPLKKEYQKYLRYMEYLAFIGMSKKIIILQTPEMNEAYRASSVAGNENSVYFYDKLKALGLLKRYDNGTKAEFVHLTFQEFFAAKYVARAIKAFCEGRVEGLNHETLLKFIGKTKWDLFYEVVYWFVAGILAGKKNQNQGLEHYPYQANQKIDFELPKTHMRLQRLQMLFDLLMQEPRNIIRYEELLLFARCLDEARMPEIMQKETIAKHIFYYYLHYIGAYENYFLPQFNRIKNVIILNPILVKFNIESFEKLVLDRLKIYKYTPIELIKLFPEKAIPLLLVAVKDENREIRIGASQAIGKVGIQAAESVILEMLGTLKDKDEVRRSTAAYILGELASQVPERIISKLLEIFKDINKNTRRAVVEALSKVVSLCSGKVISVLLEALRDQDELLRREAAEALGKVGSLCSEEVIPALLETLNKDTDYVVRITAAKALGNHGSHAPKKILPTLLEALKDPDMDVRHVVAESIEQLGSQISEKIISRLIKLLTDKEFYIRVASADTLAKLGPLATEEVIPALLEALNDKEQEVCNIAAEALGNVGYICPEKVIFALLKVLKDKDKDKDLRSSVIEALGKIGSLCAEKVIPTLLSVLKDPEESSLYRDVAKAFGKLGSQATENVIDALIKLLKNEKLYIRTAAAEALGEIGCICPEKAIHALLLCLKGKERNVCEAAVKALGRVGFVLPEKVIPELLEVLKDKEMNVCTDAAEALGKISSVNQNIISSHLEQALNNSFMLSDSDSEARKEIILLILHHIKIIPLSFLNFSINELYLNQPPSVPPSCFIRSVKDIVKVDDKGKLLTLTLCSEVMESIIKNNQESHVINQDFWTISIVRKRDGARNDNASPGFFKQIKFTNGLFDHAFIIIEGVYQSVRFAKKIDLYAEQSKSSQSNGQRIRIEITDINDFKHLEKLAENCSCMVQGISRQKAEQLEEIIKRDQEAAERGEIIYNIKGDGSFSANRQRKEHSCISWCLEKWQEIRLPLQRKWYDAIVVVPKAYLPEPEPAESKIESGCRIM